MRVLAFGDVHGDQGLVKKLADRAEKEHVDSYYMRRFYSFW